MKKQWCGSSSHRVGQEEEGEDEEEEEEDADRGGVAAEKM